MAQVTDDQLFEFLNEQANSIAVIVKHMAGNMLSRWTDFLVSAKGTATRHQSGKGLLIRFGGRA